MGVYIILKQELRILARDRQAVVLLIVVPLILTVFVAPAFEASNPDPNSTFVGTIAVEQSEVLRQMGVVDTLEVAGAKVVEISDDSPAALREGRIDAIVRLVDSVIEVQSSSGSTFRGVAIRQRLVDALLEKSKLSITGVRIISTRPSGRKITGHDIALPGFAVFFSFFAMGLTSVSFYRERFHETWRRLCAAPIRKSSIVLGKMATGVTLVGLQFAVLLGVGALAFGISFGSSPLAVWMVVLVTGALAASMGLFLTAMTSTSFQVMAVSNLLNVLMASVGGAIVPVSMMPSWMESIAPLAPHYWSVGALRALMLDGATFVDVLPEIAVLGCAAVVFFAIGASRLRLDRLTPL